jgi:glycerol-1-phosphate dehydrogenase [NAD(P)+]
VALDEPLCPTALAVADEAVGRVRAVAPGLARREPAALATLAEGLLLSGIAMALAGTSAPASGGEHLVSHYLDMSEAGWGRAPFLHGEQVGVGTCAALALYARILAVAGRPDPAGPAPVEPPGAAFDALHAHLGAAARQEVLREAEAKRDRVPDRAARLDRLARGWETLALRLSAQLAPGRALADDLAAAGAPRRFSEIDVPRARAAHALRAARHLRRRYTVLDLSSDLARLDRWADEIAEELA